MFGSRNYLVVLSTSQQVGSPTYLNEKINYTWYVFQGSEMIATVKKKKLKRELLSKKAVD